MENDLTDERIVCIAKQVPFSKAPSALDGIPEVWIKRFEKSERPDFSKRRPAPDNNIL